MAEVTSTGKGSYSCLECEANPSMSCALYCCRVPVRWARMTYTCLSCRWLTTLSAPDTSSCTCMVHRSGFSAETFGYSQMTLLCCDPHSCSVCPGYSTRSTTRWARQSNTLMFCVPRLLNKIYDKVSKTIKHTHVLCAQATQQDLRQGEQDNQTSSRRFIHYMYLLSWGCKVPMFYSGTVWQYTFCLYLSW